MDPARREDALRESLGSNFVGGVSDPAFNIVGAPLVPLPHASRAADMFLDRWVARVGHLARSGNRNL